MNNLVELASILQCRAGSLPMKYLGMPLGTSFKTASIWNLVWEKMEKKLSGWKRLYLSKGGRLTLLRSLFQVFQRTFYLSSLFLKLWLLEWNIFRGIFFGGLLRGVSNILWWLGKGCVYPLNWVVWG